jgi:rare lipoprotein A (peptidoglycan hydrolase)
MRIFALVIFLTLMNPSQAWFSKCDDENFQRPKIEEVFVQGEELSTEKFLSEMCLKPQSAQLLSKASFYGAKFQGRKTASAEPYDGALFTAAHRDLPFGSFVLVKNPSNGKEVIVRINDRGPFVGGRDLDLSDVAAKQLDIVRLGVAPIEYIILEDQLSKSDLEENSQDPDEKRQEVDSNKKKKKSKKSSEDKESESQVDSPKT